jgi:hypothetical protein
MSDEPKQYTLLRKIVKTLGLSDARADELIATIQSWLSNDQEAPPDAPHFPYHLRDDFLSPAELNFYRVLVTVTADWATLFIKVNLGDLFYAKTGEYGQNQAYRNKIDRKHVDFLLCDPNTLRPLLAIELDDNSHTRPDRQARDAFVDGVFAAAGLPLLHVPVSHSYPTKKLHTFLRRKAGLDELTDAPLAAPPAEVMVEGAAQKAETAVPTCPKCTAPMVLRKAQKGANTGNSFWGCSHYPQCRGIRTVEIMQNENGQATPC